MAQCLWKDCGLGFDSSEALVDHVSVAHINVQKTENTCSWDGCDRFGMLFHNRFSLRSHVRRHTGEKPFVCATCSKSFSRSDALAKHTKSHEPESPATSSGHTTPNAYLGPPEYLLKHLLLENAALKFKLGQTSTKIKRLSVEKRLVLDVIMNHSNGGAK